MSSHNNNVNLTPQMAAIPNPPQREVVTVFWDYENCPCPMSAKLSNLCYDIKQRIDKFIGKKLNKRIQLYCPMERLQPRTRENATDLGVLCMDVATKRKQESVDKRIIADIGLFAAELAENSGNDIGHIVLVSGDSDFGYILARLRDKSYIGKIVMFVNDFAKDTLTQHADHSCCLFQSNLTRKDNPFSDYNQRKLPNGGGGNNNNNNKSYSMSPSSYTPHSASYHNLPYMSAYHMGHVDDGSGGVGGGGGNNAQWSTYHNYPYGGGYGAAAAEAHAQHYHHQQQQQHHHDTTTPQQQQQQQQQKHAQHNTKHNNSNNGQQSASYTNLQQATVDDEKDKNKLNGANAYVYRRKDKEAAVAAAMALSVSMNNPSSKKLSKKEQKRAMKESGKKRASSKETRQRHHSHSRQQHKHAASTAATSTATAATASSTSKQVAGNVLVSSDSNESPRVVSHENLEQQLKQKQKELNEQKQQKERKQQQQQQQHKNGLSLSSHCETAPTVSASSTTTMPSSTKKTSSPSLSPSKLEFGGGQMTSLHENLASDFFAQLMPKEEEMMALLNDMNIVPSTDIFGSTSKLTTTTTTAPKTSSHVINLEQMRSSTAPKGLLLKKKPTTSTLTSMKVDENSDLNALAKLQQQQQQHQKHQKHKQEHYHPLVSEALVRCEQDGNPTPRRHDIFKAMQKVQPDLMRNKDESFADAAIDACLRGGAVEELIKGRVSSPYLLPLVLHTLTDANASTFYRSYTHQLQKCNHDITQVWIKLGDMAIYLKTRHAQQIDSYFTLAYLHRTIANAADLFAFHKDDRKKNAEQLSEAELGVIRFRLRKRRYMHSDEAQRRRQQLQLQ